MKQTRTYTYDERNETNEQRRKMATPPPTPTPIVTGTRSLKLPTFSGGQEKDDLSPLDFVERIEYCKSMKRDENDSCVEMHLALRGNTLLWWRTLKRRGINVNVWKDVRQEFLDTYSPKITGQTAHAIGQLEQKATETVNDYFNRLDQIFDEILLSFPTVPTGHTTTCGTTFRNNYSQED